MKKSTLLTHVLVMSFLFLSVSFAFSQNKKELKVMDKTIYNNSIAVQDNIMYGNTYLKIDSFYDDVDSVWVIDSYIASQQWRLNDQSPTKDEIMSFSVDTLGTSLIHYNGDAEYASQGMGRWQYYEEAYNDVLSSLYITIEKDQRYFSFFIADQDYTPYQLRMKFATEQSINSFDTKLNLGGPTELENALLSNPEVFEDLMSNREYLKIFAISLQDRYQNQGTSLVTTEAGRIQKTYNYITYGSAVFNKYDVNSQFTYVLSGSETKKFQEFIIKQGDFVLLTSQDDVSF